MKPINRRRLALDAKALGARAFGARADGARGPRKRRKLKHIAVLPSLVTLMNGLCGFTAIVMASRGLGAPWEPGLFPRAEF
ncbi:MAG: hypothetical protein FWD88_03335, partial [Treponema sp.]|nr:hypothetical protein [Treponema sp.]